MRLICSGMLRERGGDAIAAQLHFPRDPSPIAKATKEGPELVPANSQYIGCKVTNM
jgi:hypothetical protein